MTALIVSGRRSGRTKALVRRVKADPGAILVVHSAAERDRLVRHYEVPAEQVVTPGSNLQGRHPSDLFVDNTEMVLRAFLGAYPTVCVFEREP